MSTQRLGIIMHGVTGRMGMNKHLIRSIVAIRNQGGVTLSNGDKVMPDPILIGRNAEKIEALAKANGISRFGTDLDQALDLVRDHPRLARAGTGQHQTGAGDVVHGVELGKVQTGRHGRGWGARQ